MKTFKCDICGAETDEVKACQLVFGTRKINVNNEEQHHKCAMHFNDLCQNCFIKVYKTMGYKDEDVDL